MSEVVVLNADYTFLSVTSWKNAVCLIIEGKAETLRETKKIVRNVDRTVEVIVPIMIRVIKYVRSIFKSEVPFSKRNVFLRDGQVCAYCGTEIEDIRDCTIDHIVPRSQGGKTSFGNCVTACRSCNNKKADRTPSESKMYLKYRPKKPTINEYIQYCTKKYGIDKFLKSLK